MTSSERATVACLLIDPSLLPEAQASLTKDSFTSPFLGRVFAAISTLAAQGKAINYVTVDEELGGGHLGEIAGLDDYLPDLSSFPDYVDAVASAHLRHRLEVGVRAAFETERDADSLVARLESLLRGLRRPLGGGMEPLSALAERAIAGLDEPPKTVGTGFATLDNRMGGLEAGELIVLAARPGHGKTALMVDMACRMGGAGTPVAIYSLEMSHRELILRIVSAHSGVDGLRLRTGQMHQSEWTKAIQAAKKVAGLPIWIDDTADGRIAPALAKIRRFATEHPGGVQMVDYLGLMRDPHRRENRNLELGGIARDLKLAAKEAKAPILLLHQMSRKAEQRADPRPLLSDLRDSGEIEQHADRVLFIHRPNPEASGDTAVELIVAKNRHGPAGKVMLTWHPSTVSFGELRS